MHLVWIEPDIHIGSDIFSDPYNCRYESESEHEIHRVIFFIWLVIDRGFPESEEYPEDNPPPDIDDKMMRKEIDIDEYRDEYCDIFFWIVLVFKTKNPPYTCYVAPDSRVHESRKKWNMHNPDLETLRILP